MQLIASVPIFVTEIHVFAGMKTVAPPCTSLVLSPRFTRALPFCRKRISSAPGCLWRSIDAPGGRSSVPKTRWDEPPLRRSTFRMNGPGWASQPLAPSMGLQTRRSPSFFSRIRGALLLVDPFDVAEAAFEATPPSTAQMATALRAVLMGHSFGKDALPVRGDVLSPEWPKRGGSGPQAQARLVDCQRLRDPRRIQD